MRDNTLEKGPKSENRKAAIAIGEEGVTHPTPEITITNNNFRNDGNYQTALVWNVTATPATLKGNTLSGSVIPLKRDSIGSLIIRILRSLVALASWCLAATKTVLKEILDLAASTLSSNAG